MIRFVTKLELTPLHHLRTEQWAVVAAFICDLDGSRIEVPAGFVTDLASTPRWLWAIFPPFGAWDEAAVLHDWLYRTGCRPRAEADAALYHGSIECGASRAKAWLMWAAVRLFGKQFYRRQVRQE